MSRTVCMLLFLGHLACVHAGPPLIELKGKNSEVWLGKSVAHDSSVCLLEQSDGYLHRIDLTSLVEFRKAGGEFQPASPVDVKTRLAAEFGRSYEVRTLGRYVVVAPQGKAAGYADLFDDVYRSYWQYFSRRNFGLTNPEYPLVAIVFSTQKEFASYAARDKVRFSPNLKGYYDPYTNRIAFFEAPGGNVGFSSDPDTSRGYASTGTEADNTLVHEAIHQLAFNTGLHSRYGATPRWVAEGLAMMFEAQLEKDAPAGPRGGKINLHRRDWFRKSLPNRNHSISHVITDDERLFGASPLDAYAEAWSLAYFLSETRSSSFNKYLKLMASRKPLVSYSPEQRLKDFEECFGGDVVRLEVEFRRYIDDL